MNTDQLLITKDEGHRVRMAWLFLAWALAGVPHFCDLCGPLGFTFPVPEFSEDQRGSVLYRCSSVFIGGSS
jgi:hypothetical protein